MFSIYMSIYMCALNGLNNSVELRESGHGFWNYFGQGLRS